MDRGSIFRVWVPLILGAWALAIVFAKGPGPHGPTRWAGLMIAVVGFAGVMISRYTLGKSFSVTAQARALVTRGIYSKIRNPIYISGEILLVGAAIMLWQPYLLVFFVIVIPVQVLRARKEARVLEEKFGDEYREYRRQTWF
jgi:protein-S-isoprenylcysteine O-methyltransferase Ste14